MAGSKVHIVRNAYIIHALVLQLTGLTFCLLVGRAGKHPAPSSSSSWLINVTVFCTLRAGSGQTRRENGKLGGNSDVLYKVLLLTAQQNQNSHERLQGVTISGVLLNIQNQHYTKMNKSLKICKKNLAVCDGRSLLAATCYIYQMNSMCFEGGWNVFQDL